MEDPADILGLGREQYEHAQPQIVDGEAASAARSVDGMQHTQVAGEPVDAMDVDEHGQAAQVNASGELVRI